MKIFGIGTDIVNIKRIENSLKRRGSSFKKKIFSKKEILYCDKKKNPHSYYAKRFAAKAAFSKALGTGIRKGISLKNIEVSNNIYGKPSIKLDKKLYKEVKTYSEVSIYFAAIIMILDGVAGAIATNNFYKTSLSLSALTAILSWFFWAILIFVIGAKIFPDKDTKITFKKILIAVGIAHSPGLLRFLALTPDLVMPIIFLTQFWIFAGLIISTKQVLNLKSNIKSFGIVFLSFLIIAFLSISFVMSRMNMLPVSQIS